MSQTISLDVTECFSLQGHLIQTVYMHQLPGLLIIDIVKTDSSYLLSSDSDMLILLLYVDDVILTASSSLFLQRIIASLYSEFAMKDLEEILERAHMQIVTHAGPLLIQSLSLVSEVTLSVFICMTPREPHFTTALKRILRYVRGTLDYGLQLHVSSTTQLSAYTDADWAGCLVTRRSTSGYCVANLYVETTMSWIRNLLCELHTPLFTTTLVYCDNVSAVYMSANPVQHQRTKHIEIDINFVRDLLLRDKFVFFMSLQDSSML
ncbi:ribonuclease H-like domain-containing protein [Tanacetum coccineum]|uniref:Ribonuclease H-like domain-containing protein n=1 Tax=Tanacetum coccineum TaxID=301880 RepID=A0ABQ4ZDU2_9ASTR